jgi:dihydroorotase-like cyclic amidohydrolase
MRASRHAAWRSLFAMKAVSFPPPQPKKLTAADIAIWDPKRKVKLIHALLKDASDYTPYEGLNVTGWPELTMVRGRCIVKDGRLVGGKGFGKFIGRRAYRQDSNGREH